MGVLSGRRQGRPWAAGRRWSRIHGGEQQPLMAPCRGVQGCRLPKAKPPASGALPAGGAGGSSSSTPPRAASAHRGPCPSTSGQRCGPRFPGGCPRFHPEPQGQAARGQPAREAEQEAQESQSEGPGPLKGGFKQEGGIRLPRAVEGPGPLGPWRSPMEVTGTLTKAGGVERWGQSRWVVGSRENRRDQWGPEDRGCSAGCSGGAGTGRLQEGMRVGRTGLVLNSVLYKNGKDAEEKEAGGAGEGQWGPSC